MKKSTTITTAIILAVLILAYFIITKNNHTDEQTTKCIAEKSWLYVQLGCHACKIQEEIFGDDYKYLRTIDCWFEQDKCSDISRTPTWIINGETYVGVQSIEKLKELTGC